MPFFKKADTGKTIGPDIGRLLSEFNRSLMLIADKMLLMGNLIAKIKQMCPVEEIHIFLLDENTGKLKLQPVRKDGTDYPELFFTTRDRLFSWLEVNETHLVVSRNPAILAYFPAGEQSRIATLEAELIYPLKVMNHISGMLFIGKKNDGSPFASHETRLLSLLINQAAFAIEYASLYEMQNDRIKRMYRADRLATLGELAAGAAHEIRNPLTTIRSTIQFLSKDFVGDPVKKEMMAELIAETERINKIVQGLLSFARPSALNTAEVDIEQLINRCLLLIHSSVCKQRIDVQFEYFTEKTTLLGDEEQLKQVFLNILLNAVEAMSGNGPDRPRTLIVSLEKGPVVAAGSRYLIVSFEDTGRGIEGRYLENIFDPFFTTKEDGTGLGLAISYGIVRRHQGEIEVKSAPEKGTCFKIKLPQRISKS